MYRLNNAKNEQQTLFSKVDSWTDYQKKIVLNGWAGYFHDKVFPMIDEEPFRVLYSDNQASAPNTPVNILISLLILKPMMNATDEGVISSMMFDQRVQYALHTLDDDKQKISKNMLENFRRKLREYEHETKIDLFEKEMKRINQELINISKIDTSIERIDSMMISSSCKKMSRIELVYTVNYLFVKLLNSKNKNNDDYKSYLEEGNKNETIYRTRDVDSENKLSMLLNHSINLYNNYKDDKDVNNCEEFLKLQRLIEEQIDDNDKPKAGGDIKSDSMQTPYDTESTYRYKYTDNIGYTANLTEVVDTNGDENKVLVSDWEVDSNITSDKEFLNRKIEEKKENSDNNEITVIVDGAYYSDELNEKAKEVNINLHPTELVGRKGKETNLSEFKIDAEGHQILECPNGNTPISSDYNQEKGTIVAKFSKDSCINCPHKDKCPFKEQKKANIVRTTDKAVNNAKLKKERQTEKYQKTSNIRAGIEGLPSLLRRRYEIDYRPHKGKSALKMKLSTSIVAINIKRMIKINNKATICDIIVQYLTNLGLLY